MTGMTDRLLTPREVAALFRVDRKTVTRWAAAGRLGSILTPGGQRRFREAEVHALLDRSFSAETPVANAEAASGVNDRPAVVAQLPYEWCGRCGTTLKPTRESGVWRDLAGRPWCPDGDRHRVPRPGSVRPAIVQPEAASPLSDHLPTGVDGAAIGTRGGAR